MIDIRSLEASPDSLAKYRQDLNNRSFELTKLDQLLSLNAERKEAIKHAEQTKARQNQLSQQIPTLKKQGQDTSELMREMKVLAEEVKKLENLASEKDKRVSDLALHFPNHLHTSVPVGASAEENRLEKQVGNPRSFPFRPREHWELGEGLGALDFERAGKVAGTRFAILKRGLARLERCLIQFFMDVHSEEHGYIETIPPYIVNSTSYVGTGQFPKFVDDVFHLKDTDYHLISTAEVPVTNYLREEIVAESELPIRFCAFSPCFRSEAGAHGKDTKGLIRQHQFHKVELLIFSHPSQSYEWLEKLTSHAEKILERLELPYRRMALASGDIGFSSAKTYDLEVHLPGANQFREISSCSNFEDFQARRANIRFKSPGGKPQFLHTLNGSGLAVGRTLIALLENYQREDGSVEIPQALQKYFGAQKVIEPGSKKS